MSMNIYSHPGTRVRFLNENGYDHERTSAAEVFDTERYYTVSEIDVGNWSSTVHFEEVEGWWNTVMFDTEEGIMASRARKATPKIDSIDKRPKTITMVVHHLNVQTQARQNGMTVEKFTEAYGDEDLYGGDYCSVSIQIDGVEVKRYGDYYHDNGWDKAEGFVHAIRHVYPNITVAPVQYIADQSE